MHHNPHCVPYLDFVIVFVNLHRFHTCVCFRQLRPSTLALVGHHSSLTHWRNIVFRIEHNLGAD